jgi:hypothetical protein
VTPERKTEILREAAEWEAKQRKLDALEAKADRWSDWGSKTFHAGWWFTRFSFAILCLMFICMALFGG